MLRISGFEALAKIQNIWHKDHMGGILFPPPWQLQGGNFKFPPWGGGILFPPPWQLQGGTLSSLSFLSSNSLCGAPWDGPAWVCTCIRPNRAPKRPPATEGTSHQANQLKTQICTDHSPGESSKLNRSLATQNIRNLPF